MSAKFWTNGERLVAEQAVAFCLEVHKAMEVAPHGQGLAFIEAALLKHEQAFLRLVMEQVMSAQPEAKKGGAAAGGVRVEKRPPSSTTPPRFCSVRLEHRLHRRNEPQESCQPRPRVGPRQG